MVESILNIIFQPFSFEPVLYCCAFTLVVSIFGLIRRIITCNYHFEG